jgi:NAD(P)-dependent dehydrogenase (short-subunit alcohol dehydrogenase family)
VAIVTASSQGMGLATARALAEDGYRLALLARSDAIDVVADDLDAVAVRGSVTDPKALAQVVAVAHDRFGRIDAVVNNTGHPPKGDLLTIDDEAWHAGLDLVLLNVVRMARVVTPIMVAQGSGGAIVNVSTFAAFEPQAAFPVSATLRAGLATFTKLYADRYAPDRIRMNNVLPGFIDSYAVDEATRAQIPLGRPGTVEEVAATIRFLLSPGAGYITGQNIRVDGGLTRSV